MRGVISTLAEDGILLSNRVGVVGGSGKTKNGLDNTECVPISMSAFHISNAASPQSCPHQRHQYDRVASPLWATTALYLEFPAWGFTKCYKRYYRLIHQHAVQYWLVRTLHKYQNAISTLVYLSGVKKR